MQFERYAFDEISQIIGTSDYLRVRVGGCATHSDRPFVRVASGSRLLLGEKSSRVPEDNRTMYAQTLFKHTYDATETRKQEWNWM